MLVLLGKGWRLSVSPHVVLLLMLVEAISEGRGLGFEHSSGGRSTGCHSTGIFCAGHPPSPLQLTFVFYFGPDQEVSVMLRGGLSLQSPRERRLMELGSAACGDERCANRMDWLAGGDLSVRLGPDRRNSLRKGCRVCIK